MKNILIAAEFYPYGTRITGGVEARAQNIASRLSENHNVYVLSSRQPGTPEYSKQGRVTVIRIGPGFKYTNTGHLQDRIRFSIAAFTQINNLIDKYKIDVLDCYSFFAYPLSMISRCRTFLTYHEVWLGSWCSNTKSRLGVIGEIAERMILLSARIRKTRIISVSEFTAKKLEKHHLRSIVVPNGIDLDEFSLKEEKKPFTVCFAGRLVDHKRVSDLLEAVSILKNKRIKCMIAGDGPEKKNLEKLAKDLRVNAEFLGYIDRKRLVATLSSSRVFCHPGTVEGFGIALVESMAAGTPYICSDIDVFKEVTKDGKGGLIFRQKDPKDLAEKLRKLMFDDNLYRRKANECATLAREYSWDKITKKVIGAYHENPSRK